MIWIDLERRCPTDTDILGWKPWTKERWEKWEQKSQDLLNAMKAMNDVNDIKGRNALIDANGKHWGLLKPWLLALSSGKCWFSEARDIYSHLDIEHFRPKKEAKMLDDSMRDGYWWLAFSYMNFRVCGNVGNRKKGGWFPLQAGSLFSSEALRCEESEVAYLLDPIDVDDVNLLAFDEEGKAVAAPGVSDWESERVGETVKRLKLNEHEALNEARRKVWAKMSALIEQYRTAKSRCSKGGNPAAKKKASEILVQVHEMTRRSEELSSVAKWCVLMRNDPQLNKLVA